MKKTLALLALALPLAISLLAQESFDFKSLDKLGANAKNRNNITLDGDMLKMAAGLLGSDKKADQLRPLINNLRGIYIRSYEFDREGQYNGGDLEPFRAYLRQSQWNRIVDSHEGKESSEIYLQPLPDRRLGGVAIVSAEAKEVTVVYISGNLSQEDIMKLSGTMGIPNIKMQFGKQTAGKGETPKTNKHKED